MEYMDMEDMRHTEDKPDTTKKQEDLSVKKSVTGFIHSVETFGSVDGPGIRFVVFMQGCKLRCQFCHNPDTWNRRGGEPVTAEAIWDQAFKYRGYWGKKGGITASGGEPLLQMDFIIELFVRAKEEGLHTCLDTAGQPFSRYHPFFSKFNRLMQVTDLVLLDIKHMDREGHKALTGSYPDPILDMARYLSDIRKPVWLRHVLVPGKNDAERYLKQLDEFAKSLNNVERFQVLPYHTLGVYKWEQLRIPYPLAGIEAPSKEQIAYVKKRLHTEDYTGYQKETQRD